MQWPKLRKPSQANPTPTSIAHLDAATALRLKRLAHKLDELPARDDLRIKQAQELERRQIHGAAQLHGMCQELITNLNCILENLQLELSPPVYSSDSIDSSAGTLFQINANGRILQVAIFPRESAVMTEHFRIPYLLRGAIRWFNQEFLDRQEIQEQLLFYCLSGVEYSWRYLDPRSRKVGYVDQEYLAETMEQLL